MSFHDRALEDLADRLGRHQTESTERSTLRGKKLGRPIPPVEDEIRRRADVRIYVPESLRVPVAMPIPKIGRPDEGRIAHDELRLGPNGASCVWVGLDWLAVLRFELRMRISVPHQYRVVALTPAEIDVLEGTQDRLGRVSGSRSVVLLQIADPDH